MEKKPCPFCGARQDRSGSFGALHGMTRWACGTVGPDDAGDYLTGTECDKTVFRNAYLRCLELLRKVSECPCYTTDPGRVAVQIDHELYDAIVKEVEAGNES